jgi:hypothetical protein
MESVDLIGEHEKVKSKCLDLLNNRIFGAEGKQEGSASLEKFLGSEVGGVCSGKLQELVQKNIQVSYSLCTEIGKRCFSVLHQKIQKAEYKSMEEYTKDRVESEKTYHLSAKGPQTLKIIGDIQKDLDKDIQVLIANLKLREEEKKRVEERMSHEKEVLKLAEKTREVDERLFRIEQAMREQQERSASLQEQLIREQQESNKALNEQRGLMEQKMEQFKKNADEQTKWMMAQQKNEMEKWFQDQLAKSEERFSKEMVDQKEELKQYCSECINAVNK